MDNITVEFAAGALSAIKADVIRAFKSIPRRGAETGGLLCGAIVESGVASLVRIDSVIPVPVEHRFGPAYRLSEIDKASFEKAMQDWAPLGIIGWYRSQTRLGEAPDPEDRVVTAEFFPARRSAFLICYPDASLNVPGKLCVWVEGKKEEFTRIGLGRHSLLDEALQSAAESYEFSGPEPARTPEQKLPEQKEKQVERAGFTLPLPQASPQLIPQEPPQTAPQAPPQATTRNGRIALVLTLALAISFGAYLVHARLQPGSQSLAQVRPGVLGMRVDRQGSSLLVSWNRQAPEILQASAANFRIVAGERSRTLALSPHELRTGSLLYTLSAEDIEMELNVSGPVGDFAESVRVLGAAPGEQLALTPVAPRPSMEGPARSEPPRSEPALGPAPKSEDLRIVEATPKPAPPSPQQQRPAHRAFVEPPRVKTAKEALAIQPEATPPEAPLIQATNLPSVPIGVAGLLPQRNAGPGDTIDYVGPKAIRSVQPSLNATSTGMERAFAQTNKPHSVEVEVSIDERGSVSNATVGASTGPFAYLFVDAALAAARRWQFEPARRGGRPVASKMTLKFDFVKNTR